MVDLKAYICMYRYDRKSITVPTRPATQRFVLCKATATNRAKITLTFLHSRKLNSAFSSLYDNFNVFQLVTIECNCARCSPLYLSLALAWLHT